MSGRAASAGDAGFSLIEVLIALTVTALLMGFLFSGLRIGTRSERVVEERVERASELAVAQNFLRTQLANARPLFELTADGTPVALFEGRPDRVVFVGVAPAAVERGGLETVAVGLEAERGARSLVARRRPLGQAPEDPGAALATASVLFAPLSVAVFDYFGAAGETQAPSWQPTWVDMPSLPAMVRLRLVFADGRPMPDLLVALRDSPADDAVPAASAAPGEPTRPPTGPPAMPPVSSRRDVRPRRRARAAARVRAP